MCDIEGGYDVEMDSDVSESTDFDADCDAEVDSSFEELDDITYMEDSFHDMEPNTMEPDMGEFYEDTEIECQEAELEETNNEEVEMSQMEDIEPELTLPMEWLEEWKEEKADNPDFMNRVNDLIESGRLVVEEMEKIPTEEGEVKVLTREITPEIQESRERDTEVVLDNYRENLREREVSAEQIEEFVGTERDKINAEYESLDRGNLLENIYQEPVDWDQIGDSLTGQELAAEDLHNDVEENTDNIYLPEAFEDETWIENMEDLNEEGNMPEAMSLSEFPDMEEAAFLDDIGEVGSDYRNNLEEEFIEDFSMDAAMEENGDNMEEVEEAPEVIGGTIDGGDNEIQEISVNYDEIYEELQQEALEQGFRDIDILSDEERLDNSLEDFEAYNWEGLSLDRQKESLTNLAEYVEEVVGFQNPPQIEYYHNPREGDYGGYDAAANTLRINEYMLHNSSEAADTIAHELWHAHQYECAGNPQSARDYQYQYNFENYIKPDLGQEAYENQLIEAEARAFAAQFKGRLENISRGLR